MMLYGEGDELGRVETIMINLNAGNDEVPGTRTLMKNNVWASDTSQKITRAHLKEYHSRTIRP
jgi:hypothetical protein